VKKVKTTQLDHTLLSPVRLEDFSLFEEKITKIKYLKEIKQTVDKSFLIAAIDELALKGKRISAKKLGKVCKKALSKMIEEVEQ